MSLKNYIKNRKVDHFNVSGIEVFVKDPLPIEINVSTVIKSFVSRVPKHLLGNLDVIYIGSFPELEDRDLQAMYQNSSIFVTNNQASESDMIDDLIHETAHSVEETYGELIYSDKSIEKEYTQKMKDLWFTLKDEGYRIDLSYFLDPEYDEEFDKFLYAQVGYPTLSLMTTNLFFSPYAATSLSEYFANGFESFFMRENIDRLKKISPRLYKKLIQLLNFQNKEANLS